MTPAHPTAAADTNFCVDLHCGTLLDCLAFLEMPIVLLDVIEDEITKQDVSDFHHSGMIPDSATPEEVIEFMELRRKYPAPSTPDLITLTVCRKRGWVLLTGDGPLRKAAQKEQVPCRGILWFLDQLEIRQVPPQRLYDSLQEILRQGAYLPESECQSRLKKWGPDGC